MRGGMRVADEHERRKAAWHNLATNLAPEPCVA